MLPSSHKKYFLTKNTYNHSQPVSPEVIKQTYNRKKPTAQISDFTKAWIVTEDPPLLKYRMQPKYAYKLFTKGKDKN